MDYEIPPQGKRLSRPDDSTPTHPHTRIRRLHLLQINHQAQHQRAFCHVPFIRTCNMSSLCNDAWTMDDGERGRRNTSQAVHRFCVCVCVSDLLAFTDMTESWMCGHKAYRLNRWLAGWDAPSLRSQIWEDCLCGSSVSVCP